MRIEKLSLNDLLKDDNNISAKIADGFMEQISEDLKESFKKKGEVHPTIFVISSFDNDEIKNNKDVQDKIAEAESDDNTKYLGVGVGIKEMPIPGEIFSDDYVKNKFFLKGGEFIAKHEGNDFLGIIMISEAWKATAKNKEEVRNKKPSEMANREEIVLISAFTVDTSHKTIFYKMDKENKKLIADEMNKKMKWENEMKDIRAGKKDVGMQNNLLKTFYAGYAKGMLEKDGKWGDMEKFIKEKGEEAKKERLDDLFNSMKPYFKNKDDIK